MRRYCLLPVLTLLVAATTALAATGPATSIALVPGAAAGSPSVAVAATKANGLTLVLELPSVDVADQELAGRTFRSLDIADGGHRGLPGQPALPTITRLVALPSGSGVTARLVDHELATVGTFALAPVEPVVEADKASTPTFDATWYAAAAASEPEVLVGEPALMHGQRVVPITFSPVAHDPASGRTDVARRMTVEVLFEGRDDRADKAAPSTGIAESFATIFEQEIIGWTRGVDVHVGPGSYILICPNNSTVVNIVERLAEWRRRQGYNVLVVTTATTGNTTTSIKSWLQAQYDTLQPPLEFVTLVGDANGTIAIPTWIEGYSGYGGEGDHMYTTLDGPDVLADIHIGRLSVTSTSQLQTVVDKIVDYESDPDLGSTNWFTTAGLTGDPSTSGWSCVFVNQFVKQELLRLGYTRVDTIWSGNFLNQMIATINQGESIFTYRGYWYMSGMASSHILNLTNGRKLPFSVIMTCGTGSFRSETTCRSEAFLRATNGGGVASIGTATTGTNTRYNNCVFLGVMHGLLTSGDFRTGPALTRGKLNMYKNYGVTEGNYVWAWSTWNNIMGDAATEIFTAVPASIVVEHPAAVSLEANALPVTVSRGGVPVAGARVAVYQAALGQVRDTAYTDAAGQAVLSLAGAAGGEVLVTVTGVNLRPYLGATAVGPVARSLDLDMVSLREAQGNGNGIANPGEVLDVSIALHNAGMNSVVDATATLTSPTPHVTVIDGVADYGTVAGGAVVTGTFRVQVAGDAPGGVVHALRLDATGSGQTWTSLVDLPVHGPRGALVAMTFSGPGGNVDPGESGNVSFTLGNVGNLATTGVTGTLTCTSPWVTVTDGGGTWGPVAADGEITQFNPFAISVSPSCLRGHLTALKVTLTFAEGGTQVLEYPVTIGTAGVGDPTGPCAYGYWAFNNGDNHELAPTYNWHEISTIGTNIGISDTYRHDDETRTVDLPFAFNHYGQTYSRVSICSNGWLAFGATYLVHYRNWMMPADGSPSAMVAAFWTDLANGQVFTYHDTAQHRFIVQWQGFRNYDGSSYSGNCTFQIILHDPAHHATETGDGLIVMQFKNITIYAPPPETNYFTTGIQDHTREVGFTYAYGNRYAGGAATIAANRAIAFWPLRVATTPTSVPDAGSLHLAQNHPNPFNPQTVIDYELPAAQHVVLRVYDLQGKLVSTLMDGVQSAGRHELVWHGRDQQGSEAPSGLYFYRLTTADGDLVRKMTLLK